MDELERWLQDLMRQGLASKKVHSYQFWDDIAARMVDAQAPGLAKRLRDCAGIPHTGIRGGQDWPERLLMALGKLHLLIQGYRRIDRLPLPLQAELRTQIGWNHKKAEILALATDNMQQSASLPTVLVQSDDWQVIGIRILEEEKLWSQRIWLWGINSDRPAFLLNYSYGRPQFGPKGDAATGPDALDVELVPGIIIPAELVFYPAAYPLRALVKQLTGRVKPLLNVEQSKTVAEAIACYSQALSHNPWLERMPFLLKAVIPYLAHDPSDGSEADVRDAYVKDAYVKDAPMGANNNPQSSRNQVMGLPIHPKFSSTWELLALSSGHPVAIAAEWDGTYIWPLSVLVEHRLVIF